MSDEAKAVVEAAIEPGEEILWTGRPEVEAATSGHRPYGKIIRRVAIAAVPLLVLWFLPDSAGLGDLLEAVDAKAVFLVVAVLLLILVLPILKQDTGSRLDRYFRSLTYAITDRRLLILENGQIEVAYTPERITEPRISKRSTGHADVIFDRHVGEGRSSAMARERARVGFKALPNAEEVKGLIEQWLEDNIRRAEEDASDYLEPAPPGTDESSDRRVVVNRRLGLELTVPMSWTLRVRRKKKPYGTFGLDVARWKSLDGDEISDEDWNVVLVEGPSGCKVELEVFETTPTVAFERLSKNRLADTQRGKVIDSDPAIEINGIPGFTVTRRKDPAPESAAAAMGEDAIIKPERETVLHDGRRQVYILSSWPEESEPLERAVDAVMQSVELQ